MKIISLLYHEVTNDPKNSGFQRIKALPYKHTQKEFHDHLLIINKHFRNITTIYDLKKNKKNILLTFDDGGKSNMYIADLLDEYNFKGHFFIPTSFIGKPHFLSEKDLIDLHSRGHIIGSHSHSHPNVFKSLTGLQMNDEWVRSSNILSSLLNTNIDCCSVPGGDANMLCYEKASLAGYSYIFNSEPTVFPENFKESLVLGRISMKTKEPIRKLKRVLFLRGLTKMMLIRKLKVLVKTIIFPIYSHIHNSRKHESK